MSKKAVLGVLAAAIAVAYGGSTWWAGTKVKSAYDNAFAELPKQTALVRVIERQYERGFLGATSTVTLEIGCAADTAAPAAAQAPAVKPPEGEEQAEAAEEEEEEAESTPPKPVRITFRDTIRHGPIAGGSFAAATIDSELVLDIKAQAQAEKLFGKAKPVTAHTKVGFDGAYISDIVVAPAKFAEEGKGQLAWQGAKARVEVNAARTKVRYDMTMPGMDVNDPAKGLQLKMGSFTAKADMDSSAGWILATGKTEGRLEAFEFSATKGLGATDADAPAGTQKPVKLLLQNIDLIGQASIKDGLYASDGTLKGKGKIGETAIDSFEMTSGARRIHAAGYKKLADAWLQSSAAGGCGKSSKASKAAMQALADQLAPDLKAMAKYSPEFGLDKMAFEIGGKRGELGYTASMAGVTDEDLQEPGMALLMKRGVLKAHARLPMQWLETIAAIGAESGQTPPPEMLAGLVEQGEEKGFVKREGDDVTAQLEFSEGNLKVNGKPLNAMGQ